MKPSVIPRRSQRSPTKESVNRQNDDESEITSGFSPRRSQRSPTKESVRSDYVAPADPGLKPGLKPSVTTFSPRRSQRSPTKESVNPQNDDESDTTSWCHCPSTVSDTVSKRATLHQSSSRTPAIPPFQVSEHFFTAFTLKLCVYEADFFI